MIAGAIWAQTAAEAQPKAEEAAGMREALQPGRKWDAQPDANPANDAKFCSPCPQFASLCSLLSANFSFGAVNRDYR